ncbi:BRCT domain-containing protein [Sulfuricurvum sp.]|uniref:BRCT domain-containing protein n=1 Tax=Sulfuricurvum sp. TaxID=2025608 RepID=UPI003BAFD9DA
MEIFTRFNRKHIQDRQVDTLIGLSKGLIADEKVNQKEAEFLLSWLVQNRYTTENPIILNLLEKVDSMLKDGILDTEESTELLGILKAISGEKSEIGELSKTSTLPINDPMPPITFERTSFLFTGTCAFGTRKQCQDVIESLGGINANGVTKTLNYLILGTYVTDSWAHENFGRKIEKAIEYRDNGIPLVIITEEHWANEAQL